MLVIVRRQGMCRLLAAVALVILVAIGPLPVLATEAVLEIDGEERFAWSYAAGWVEAATNEWPLQVRLTATNGALEGRMWSEQIGWMAMGTTNGSGPYANNSATNWGVNVAVDGTLSGYAWAPSVGWISFQHPQGCRLHPLHGYLSGYAESDALGTIRFGAAPVEDLPYGVGFAMPLGAYGVPEWWYRVNGFVDDEGAIDPDREGLDGQAFWEGTDPADPAARLAFTQIVQESDEEVVLRFVGSPYRRYQIEAADVLPVPTVWSNVAERVGMGGEIAQPVAFGDAPATTRFFRVRVELLP